MFFIFEAAKLGISIELHEKKCCFDKISIFVPNEKRFSVDTVDTSVLRCL